MAAVVALRGWPSFAGLDLLTRRGLLWHGMVWDDGREWPAWVITDSTLRNVHARRLDGGLWQGIGGKKAKSLPGVEASWPIGAPEIGERSEVILCEGQPDFCAALLVAWWEGMGVDCVAPIWQNLRGERLDETAIIATPVPEAVSAAMKAGDPAKLEAALAAWNPVVPVAFDADNVQKTIAAFAKVVDWIEDHEFRPPPLSDLTERDGERGTFATRVCRNCDMRFSCTSYREYARKYRDRGWSKFADFYDLAADEAETLARFDATAPDEDEQAGGAGQD
jgi:hypothetical protein